MKTIGLLGGMSWESTVEYYRLINEEVKLRLGGLHSARIALYSVDFEEIEKLQHANRWAEAADRSEEHTPERQPPCNLVCRPPLEKKT